MINSKSFTDARSELDAVNAARFEDAETLAR